MEPCRSLPQRRPRHGIAPSFAKSLDTLKSHDGSKGVARFNCPHELALYTRRSEAEFYITNRRNSRFQESERLGNAKRQDTLVFNCQFEKNYYFLVGLLVSLT
jgi:hypothetical protein